MSSRSSKIACIYRLTNLLTGQKYIGRTNDFRTRMRGHKNKKKNHTYLSRAIQKWGWKNFRREIVVTAPVADLNRLEMEYIERERTFLDPRHYNLTAGGEGTCGHRHSKDTKKKISESSRKTDRSVCGCVMEERSGDAMSRPTERRKPSRRTTPRSRRRTSRPLRRRSSQRSNCSKPPGERRNSLRAARSKTERRSSGTARSTLTTCSPAPPHTTPGITGVRPFLSIWQIGRGCWHGADGSFLAQTRMSSTMAVADFMPVPRSR